MKTKFFFVKFRRANSEEVFSRKMLAVNEADVKQKLSNDDSFDGCVILSIEGG